VLSLSDRVYPTGRPPLLRWTIAPGDLPRGRPTLRVEPAPGGREVEARLRDLGAPANDPMIEPP